VGQLVDRGRDPRAILSAHQAKCQPDELTASTGPTLARYVREHFLPYNQPPRVRKAQARDYRRHFTIVIERLGDVPLATLAPVDVHGLQAELLNRGLSVKYVKNILSGSLRALIAQALDGRAIAADPFPRRLKWPRWKPPGADPLTADERTRIVTWFAPS
jgi:hypothetical protein